MESAGSRDLRKGKRHSRDSGRRLNECLTVWRRGWDGRYAPSLAATPLLDSNRVLILDPLGKKTKRPIKGLFIFWRRGWDRPAASLPRAARVCRTAAPCSVRSHGFELHESCGNKKSPLEGAFLVTGGGVSLARRLLSEFLPHFPVPPIRSLLALFDDGLRSANDRRASNASQFR